MLGVVSGVLLSRQLRRRIPWIDPVIIGSTLLLRWVGLGWWQAFPSVPFLVAGIQIARDSIAISFFIVFIGMYFINFNWCFPIPLSPCPGPWWWT